MLVKDLTKKLESATKIEDQPLLTELEEIKSRAEYKTKVLKQL